MNKLKLKTSLLTSFIVMLSLYGFPQIHYKTNWQNLDLNKDSVLGISTELAYKDLLRNKVSLPVIVAVIDGGIDIDHEDLKDAIWTNKKEIPANGKDDDHNGYADDIHGWNFMGSAKGSFIYDNIDLVRSLRAARINSPESNDTRSLWIAYQSKRDQLLSSFKLIETQYYALMTICSKISAHPLPDQLINYRYKSAAEEEMLISFTKGLKSDPEYVSTFTKQYKSYKDQIDYWVNLNYNPRNSTADYQKKYYGNPDVKGIQPVHGTHVAGIIGAMRNNHIGIQGVADNVRIMSLIAIPEGEPLDLDIANAIIYAADNGARIINISSGKFTSPDKEIVDRAVQYAMKKNVLIVHSAGNNGMEIKEDSLYPNRYYKSGGEAAAWIEVGASAYKADNELLPWFSNYSKKNVDVFAPGVSINSTWFPEKYQVESGTSMAAPVVTGLAALIMEYFPKLAAEQVKQIILESVLKIDHKVKTRDGVEMNFSDTSKTGGIVNAYQAIRLAQEYK